MGLRIQSALDNGKQSFDDQLHRSGPLMTSTRISTGRSLEGRSAWNFAAQPSAGSGGHPDLSQHRAGRPPPSPAAAALQFGSVPGIWPRPAPPEARMVNQSGERLIGSSKIVCAIVLVCGMQFDRRSITAITVDQLLPVNPDMLCRCRTGQ